MMIACYIESDDYVPMLEASAASARRVMPDVPVFQIGPRGVPRAVGIDGQLEFDLPGNFARRVWKAKASVEAGDVLFADCDTIFHADVTGVFDQAFDVALPKIADPFVAHTAGVAFCRNPAFWGDYEAMPLCRGENLPDIRRWLEDWNRFVAAWRGKVLKLPQAIYEYLPKGPLDPCAGAAIAHYRGPRKRWMPGLAIDMARLSRAH